MKDKELREEHKRTEDKLKRLEEAHYDLRRRFQKLCAHLKVDVYDKPSELVVEPHKKP